MQILCVMFDVLCVYAERDICTQKKSGKPHIGFTAWKMIDC